MRTALVILLALLFSGCMRRPKPAKQPAPPALFELNDCVITSKSEDGKRESCECLRTRPIGIDARNGATVYECNSPEVKK